MSDVLSRCSHYIDDIRPPGISPALEAGRESSPGMRPSCIPDPEEIWPDPAVCSPDGISIKPWVSGSDISPAGISPRAGWPGIALVRRPPVDVRLFDRFLATCNLLVSALRRMSEAAQVNDLMLKLRG
jgi:hypothetical protein